MKQAFTLAAALTLAAPAAAEPLIFEGRVEAASQAELSSQLNGVVLEILFAGGEQVIAGQPMIRLDPADSQLDLAAAEAALASAEAELVLATQEADRARRLNGRGIASSAQLQSAEAALRAAEAAVAMAKVDRDRALLALERTVIRAPITGFAGRPMTSTGAFLEAESGAPLGHIVSLDPVIVAYRVPYATRIALMERTGAPSIDALLSAIELSFELPGGTLYPHRATPEYASAFIDPEDGTVTVRASVPNPDGILRPGMALTVESRVVRGGEN